MIAAAMAFASGAREVKSVRREAAAERQHREAMVVLERELASLERIWRLLFTLESSGALTDEEYDDYIVATMWLQPEIRKAATAVLVENDEGPDSASVSHLRHLILTQVQGQEHGED